eukprot:1642385-Amphidinium_carterae.1
MPNVSRKKANSRPATRCGQMRLIRLASLAGVCAVWCIGKVGEAACNFCCVQQYPPLDGTCRIQISIRKGTSRGW